jgi:hypothetical protein
LHAGVPNATSVGNGSITDRTNNAVNRAQTEKQPRKAVLGPLIHRDDDHVWRKVCKWIWRPFPYINLPPDCCAKYTMLTEKQ